LLLSISRIHHGQASFLGSGSGGGLILAPIISSLGSASELLSLMLRPNITRACSSPISFNTPPNSAPFVGGCSWDFKLSRDARIFQKARATCW
ncbi:hypothetical protein LINPERHAP1_LOCUS4653, partial [Linum perenne]